MSATAGGPAHDIVFGTDGWRARIADEFTFENVRRCADGVADYVAERGGDGKGVVIAYDRRFASEHFAAAAAEVILARDIPVAIAVHAVPTQMSSYEVVERGAAAGIVITASHNPWVDNGFKVKAPTGAAGGPGDARRDRGRLAVNGGVPIDRRPLDDAEAAGLVERFDPFEGYERFVRRTVDLDALRAADIAVLVDPLWGAGAGWLSRLLGGGRIRVHEIHQERNPFFGGVNPEPIRPNVDEALAAHRRRRLRPRAAARRRCRPGGRGGRDGTFIHQLQVTGLLMYYLAEHRGWRDPVVVSVNNTSMAARLGERYGIATFETPVGFKFIGPKMIETGAMMGAEESGGFGFGMHLPERDGIYADLLLLDLFLREKAAGRWPVSKAIAALPRDRRAVVLSAGRRPRRARRVPGDQAAPARRPRGGPPSELAGSPSPGRSASTPGRLQVLPRRRVMAAHPGVRHRAARARLHGGDVGRGTRSDARRR